VSSWSLDILPPGKVEKVTTRSDFSVNVVEYQYAYTVDGSEPDSSSMLYRRPFDLPVDTVLKMRTFRPNGRGSPTIVGAHAATSGL